MDRWVSSQQSTNKGLTFPIRQVLTIVFNIIVTAMIAVRLLSMHSRVNRVVGEAMTKKYTGLLAILVESALPFTLLGVCYLATYIREIPESLAFADIWGACELLFLYFLFRTV